jgi:hypothetical protein
MVLGVFLAYESILNIGCYQAVISQHWVTESPAATDQTPNDVSAS